MREVCVFNDYEQLSYNEEVLIHLLQELDSFSGYSIPAGELSIAFVDDARIAQLHQDFMDDPTATDVITFIGDPEHDFAGEICISVDHAKAKSVEFNQTFNEELTLYLIHGWLHLSGLDDREEQDRQKMRKAEAETIAWISEQGLSLTFIVDSL